MNKKWILLLVVCMALPSLGAIPKTVAEKEIFSPDYTLEVRWKKYHDYILKNPKSANHMAEKALKSKDWFLREAGLKTLMVVDKNQAKKHARHLLEKDPSMLVRASAVTAIKILKDTSSEDLLWTSMIDSKNFRKEQSLWIRPQIMATLIEFKSQNKEKFKEFYNDKDPQVVRLAKIAAQ